jgi:hypothetical protein
MNNFIVKDSGERHSFGSGMVRDTAEDKIDYSLAFDGPLFRRWAIQMTSGAKKYNKRNWMQANGQEELERFRESAIRHFCMWVLGYTDEDHIAATLFNLNGFLYTMEKLDEGKTESILSLLSAKLIRDPGDIGQAIR